MAPESKEWGKVPGAGSLPSLWSKEVKTQLILDAKIIDCSNISTLALILWAWI